MKLLIVDSDRDLVEMLTGWLKTLGHQVRRAYSGRQARIEWKEQQPDLVILDMSLNNTDALAMCRDMQRKHDALLMIVTDRTSVQDEIRCLEAGADDYIRKPFFPKQLLAHIRAISRRTRFTSEQPPSSILTVGPIQVDSLHNEVSIHGKTSRLTPMESKLLHFLAVNANTVCAASQILSHLWGLGNDGDSSTIKVLIHRLRQKIELNPSNPHYILTVPGMGYKLMRQHEKELHTDFSTAFSHLSVASE
jgi:DNA-binding response OmpR family regulator